MQDHNISRRRFVQIVSITTLLTALEACGRGGTGTTPTTTGVSPSPSPTGAMRSPSPSPTAASSPSPSPTAVVATPTTALGEGTQGSIGLPKQIAEGKTVSIRVENTPRPEDRAAFQLWKDKIGRFNKLYPNVKIVSDTYTWDPSTFPARIQGGTAGDLWLVPFTEVQKLISQKVVADITDLMQSWQYFKDWNPGMLKIVTGLDGRIYGIPAGGYVMGLVYNRALYKQAGLDPEKPPRTWDELATYAQKLTNRSKNQAGFAVLTTGNQGGWQLLNFVWQAGGDFERQVNGKWQAVFDSPQAARALQFYHDLRWRYDVLPRNTLLKADDIFPMLASEQLAMAIFSPGWIDIVVSQHGGKLEDFGMAPLPAGPAGRAEQTGGAVRFINAKSSPEAREAAFWFAIWEEFDLNEVLFNTQAAAMAGKLVGLPDIPLMRGEYQRKLQQIISRYTNVPTQNYRLYIQEAGRYARPEPPIEAQALYALLDPVVQAVLTDRNADPATLLSRAAREFQTRFLDKAS